MALTAASVLHYWSSRYGALPIVGGRPAHSRSSAAAWTDQQGTLQNAIVNTPRFNWATIAAERRPVLALEMARTNPVVRNTDFSNAAWTKTGITVVTGKPDPAGGTSACRLTATGANADITQNPGDTTSANRFCSCYLRRVSGAGTIYLWNPNGVAQIIVALPADGSWARVAVNAATVGQYAGIRIGNNGDVIDAYGFQVEPVSVSSLILTVAAAATRAVDTFAWDFDDKVRGYAAYIRFVERGSAQIASASLLEIGTGSNPRFAINVTGSGRYQVLHHNGTSQVANDNPFGGVSGDVVELVALLTQAIGTDGRVRIIQSINGAGVDDSTDTAALSLTSAWSSRALNLNGVGAVNVGLVQACDVKIVKYQDTVAAVGGTAQQYMDELRAFELTPAGEVIA